MARSRIIKPEFFKHAELYDAELATGLPLRIAFAGLWCQSDREGRFAWKPRELKLDVLPHDALDFADVLGALERFGFVESYEVAGKRYGRIPTFKDHQSFHIKEGPSRLPPPPPPAEPPVERRAKPRERKPAKRDAASPSTTAPGEHGASTGQAPCDDGASTPVSISVTASTSTHRQGKERRDEPTRTPIAIAGDLWKARRGEPSYPRIGKALKPLFAARGVKQVLMVWDGYLMDRDGKSFATPEDFASNYEVYRTKWGRVIGEDGCTWEHVADEPEAAA